MIFETDKDEQSLASKARLDKKEIVEVNKLTRQTPYQQANLV